MGGATMERGARLEFRKASEGGVTAHCGSYAGDCTVGSAPSPEAHSPYRGSVGSGSHTEFA